LSFDGAAFLPGQAIEAVVSAGACRGVYELEAVIADGVAAGTKAVQSTVTSAPGFLGALPEAGKPSGQLSFVDFQNDVTTKDLGLAVREGFRSIEHIKRYTTNGMATDQGKTSNMNALSLAAGHLGKALPQVGLTTFRQPFTPTSFGIFAGQARGELFDPVRRTPIHGWAQERGAVFEEVALWMRARYFPSRAKACTKRSIANVSPPHRRGNLRRLDPGQDRSGRQGCRRIHEPHLCQSVDQAGTRPLPLRRDAARRRHDHG